ncbi:MAG: glycerophosphodiester phosphodiesterase [Candidatus Saccharimonadales bacterium]
MAAQQNIISHRGAGDMAPENTLASLIKAVERGAKLVEIDVRVTKDKVPVLNHNSFVAGGNGRKLPIYLNTLAELRAHKFDLATLQDAIAAIDHKIPLILDIKPDEPLAPIVDVIQASLASGWRCSDFLFVSFDFKLLKSLHVKLPDIPIVINEHYSIWRVVRRARKLRTKTIGINHHYIWPAIIKLLQARGYQIYVYTLNDPAKARKWQKLGLAGIVTDFPDRF